MRSLRKSPMPDVLRQHGAKWTAAYVEAAARDRVRLERWRHQDIKATLEIETNEKCAYCESRIADVAYSNVEHMKPKSTFPELAHAWFNLTLACPRCNTAKGDFFSESAGIIDPYRDEPEQRIQFLGSFADFVAGDAQAEVTISRLQLNRIDLVRSRTDRLAAVRQLLERWKLASGDLKTTLEAAIQLDAQQGEYSRSVQVLLAHHSFPISSDPAQE